jgi:hypothetical protein
MQQDDAMLGPLRTAAATPASTPEPPIDHTHEMPAIYTLERAGYTADFRAEGGDTLRVSGTTCRYAAKDVRIRDYYRFEGVSDPDDMSVIYAVETVDGTRGMLIDAYGTYADPAIAAVVDRMAFQPPADLSAAHLGAQAVVQAA